MGDTERKWHPKRTGNGRLWLIAGVALMTLVLLIGLAISLSIRVDLQVNEYDTFPQLLVYGKDTYQEAGATATVNGKPIDVEISGAVDMQKLGNYTITYRAEYLWITKTETRVIRVIDTTAPVITLNQIPGHLTLPGEEYQEEGFTAIDDYDGDITDKVQVTVEENKVTYTVKDSSGNVTTQEREIVRKDIVPPVITLNGEAKITLKAGASFTDPGVTATDNIDGDLTAAVTISGTVNTYLAGTYTLTYTVVDAAGNTTTAERTVVVEAIKQPETVSPGGKVIYLTFDDGPSRYTQQLLDVLAKYNAKATFFVVNTGHSMKTLLNGIVDGGHGIGIHSVSHEYAEIYANEEAFFNDLYTMQGIIKDKTGVTTTMMRFPGGSSNSVSKKYNKGIMTRLTQAVQDQGFQYFDWNVSSGDAGGAKTADEVYNNVINGIGSKKTAVVLQHDIQKFSVEAVERILIWGLNNGYTFQALTPNSPTCHHPVNN